MKKYKLTFYHQVILILWFTVSNAFLRTWVFISFLINLNSKNKIWNLNLYQQLFPSVVHENNMLECLLEIMILTNFIENCWSIKNLFNDNNKTTSCRLPFIFEGCPRSRGVKKSRTHHVALFKLFLPCTPAPYPPASVSIYCTGSWILHTFLKQKQLSVKRTITKKRPTLCSKLR